MIWALLLPLFLVSAQGNFLGNPDAILKSFKQKYNNSQSDLIFLLDVSGSVSHYGFRTEKIFVDNLLNEFSVAPYSTRVVVITFDNAVKTEIDYIDVDPADRTKNKCEFKPVFTNRVKHRQGWATDMKAAFERTMAVLKSASNKNWKRKNVHTVTMMITDGWWNRYNPNDAARRLKTTPFDNELFMVGVGGYRKWQLDALASSSSHVLEFKSFQKFKELASYIRGDAHDRVYMRMPNKCTTPCDANAFCACGTVSGIYQCVCNAGYSGIGLRGECRKCGRGFYKKWPSPEECTPCPMHSTTKGEGSTTIHECFCFEGYIGSPALPNRPCTAVRCGALPTPTNGRKTAPCDDVYLTTCEFECNVGYNLVGSRSRTCQKTGQWSGVSNLCQAVQCASLPLMPQGTKTCTGTTYGKSCTFTCNNGYDLQGSTKRTCQLDGTWTGTATSCKVKLCPALRNLAFGTVLPVDCVTKPQPYGQGCVLRCASGYQIDNAKPLTCGIDGKWQGKFPTCKDINPPVITCPASIIGNTDPESPTKMVVWDIPAASDNAELYDPNAKPKVTSSHPFVKSPYEFAVGTTRIVYTATDKSNLTVSCTLTITVSDNEPPFISCPENMQVTKKSDGSNVKVYWKPPVTFDNSRLPVKIFTQSVNGTEFPEGPHTITYSAVDAVGNKNKCTFVIQVSGTYCKTYDPPINGAVVCEKSPYGGDQCTPQCNSKYDFSRVPAEFYMCMTQGLWYPWASNPAVDQTMPWPDCTSSFDPNAVKGMEWQYFTGDCNSPATQLQAKKNFIQGLKEVLGNGDPNYCASMNACKLDKIRVACGKTQAVGKRSISQANVLKIELELDVPSNGRKYSDVEAQMNSFMVKLRAAKGGKLNTLHVPGMSSQFKDLIEQNVQRVCQNGTVYEMNTAKPQKCQSCPSGTYYDAAQTKCVKCPINTYQDAIGSLSCKQCSRGLFTNDIGSKISYDCKFPCPAGQHSPTGLVNCRACEIGYYQPDKRQTTCRKCPGSTTTLRVGATSINECGMPCAPGSHSRTGVEPCTLCPVGTYQPKHKENMCVECPTDKSTYGVGSSQLSQCVVINYCGSNPCNNAGVCVNNPDDYECKCPLGYSGKHCEIDEDDCVTNPCALGATCVDKVNGYVCLCPVGYTGPNCDKKVTQCSQSLCVNGKCIETPSGAECICQDGFSGEFCESKDNECKNSPCQNGGRCTNNIASFSCVCLTGFTGERCEKKTNGCQHDSCSNGGVCTETSYGFKCTCAKGFSGSRCDVNINECANSPCKNNGMCVDQVGGFKCLCKAGYNGANCEIAGSSDFDINFERSKARSTSLVGMRQELRAFTISFWMKSAEVSNIDPGTPISYAVEDKGELYDNALVIHDYNAFNIWINNEKVSTNIAANDGKWHHMAFTWKSSTGHWKVYKDGSKIKTSSTPFQQNQAIAAGGLFALGQEQDVLGGNFTANEAFYGSMSQMNIWSYELDSAEIANMGRHAEHRNGNIMAWSDFLVKMDKTLKKVQPSIARQNNKCWSNWIDRSRPTSSGESESNSGACSSAYFDCQTLAGEGEEDLELTFTCASSGVSCLSSKQADTTKICPNFKFRAVCSCPANSACSTNRCHNNGVCVNLPIGYKCNCPVGFEGKHCEKALNCPNPGPLVNGRISSTSSLFEPGTTATFTCNSGFTRVGAQTLRCHSGKWQGAIPVCKDINECSQHKCQHSCTNFDGGYKCSCANGYQLQNDGTCRDINECLNNNGNCQQKCYNTVGSYRCSCSPGYRLVGGSCQDIDECAANQGLGSCGQLCINHLASFKCQCKKGYVLNSDGKTCRGLSCPSLGTPSNTKRFPLKNYVSLGSIVRFECNDGYRLVGSSMRTCMADGQWSGVASKCVGVQCIVTMAPLNGHVQRPHLRYGSVAKYSCRSGFRVLFSSQRVCGKDGRWTNQQPLCLPAHCPEPSDPTNGKSVGLQRNQGDTIRYECISGFRVKGSSYAVCQSDRRWSNPTPTCELINCGKPLSLANGVITGSVYTYGAKVQYSCNKDFHLSGPKERQCENNGLWSDKEPVCLERSCGHPGDFTNGVMSGNDFTYGKAVTFKCNVGYTLSGSSSRTCQTNGLWTGSQPKCIAVNCGNPGVPRNGEVDGTKYTYGVKLRFDCLPGFRLVGSIERSCGANGKWSGTQPRCEKTNCGAKLVGPTGRFSTVNFPNSYNNNEYCRWTITVRSDRQVMITFKTLKTQPGKDFVEVYDGKSGQLISKLSGVLGKTISLTSNSNIMDVKFYSDASDVSVGFEATYEPVSCGGLVTQLDSIIKSPNYPNNYPGGAKCVWALNIGAAFQLEFDSFNTEPSYDTLKGYNSISSAEDSNLSFEFEDEWLYIKPVQSTTGQMLLQFSSNYYNHRKGFQLQVKKYRVIVGRKKRDLAFFHY